MKKSVFCLAATAAFSIAVAQPGLAQMMMIDESDEGPGGEIAVNVPIGPDGIPMLPPMPSDDEAGGPPAGVSIQMMGAPFPPPEMMLMTHGRGPGGPGRGHGGPGGPGGWEHGRHHGGMFMHALSGENALTDEQYEKIYELKNQTMDRLGPKMVELHAAMRHLKDQLTRENIDDKAVKRLQNQVSSLKSDIETIKIGSHIEMMESLTPAQRKALRHAMVRGPEGMRREMMKKWHEKRKETSEGEGKEPS